MLQMNDEVASLGGLWASRLAWLRLPALGCVAGGAWVPALPEIIREKAGAAAYVAAGLSRAGKPPIGGAPGLARKEQATWRCMAALSAASRRAAHACSSQWTLWGVTGCRGGRRDAAVLECVPGAQGAGRRYIGQRHGLPHAHAHPVMMQLHRLVRHSCADQLARWLAVRLDPAAGIRCCWAGHAPGP
jgi:hypothetical protein